VKLPDYVRMAAGETIGTYLLVLFGTGAVAAAVITGAQVGLWQVAAVWGLGVALAIYATAHISGAHLNPAVTLAFAIFRRRQFPLRRLPLYWLSQLTGGVLAGATVWWLFGNFIKRFETDNGIVRGEVGSEHSAMVFGQYFPNPDIYGTGEAALGLISPGGAMAVEAFGTGVLVLIIFAVTERRSAWLSSKNLGPLLIGFTVAALISLFAPLTQGGWNPARDFGPRLVSLAVGWGDIAVPGPQSSFWIYIAGPLIGGPIGAAVHELVLKRSLAEKAEKR